MSDDMNDDRVVSLEVIDIFASSVRVFDEIERTVVPRSNGRSVRYEGRFYQLFTLPGAAPFIDLGHPCGKC